MNVVLFQPPYPEQATREGSRRCIAWMIDHLPRASFADVDLILLPEFATAPGVETVDDLIAVAGTDGTRLLEACAETAKTQDLLIALGTVDRGGGVLRNRALLISKHGVLAHYDKVHLTDVEKDVLQVTPGGRPATVKAGTMNVAFATCFDVYFAEFFAALAAMGADLVLSPSYQRSESAERIRLLSACRALDCGAWFLRAGYAMRTPGRGGHSLVAHPDGTLIADAGEEACLCRARIDLASRFLKPASHGQAEIDHRTLLEAHRRPGFYRPAVDRQDRALRASFPRICAHRGLSRACPENTLPAFAAAIALDGVHEIELDLWLSRDGVAVVCHDATVDRTTNGCGRITDMNWSDIRALDASAGLGETWSGVRIPRLEEVLDLVDSRVGVNIHIKDPGPSGDLVRLTVDLLRERGLDRLAYLAGGVDVLQAACEIAPEIERCCLAFQREPARMVATAVEFGCMRVQFGRGITSDDTLRAAHHGLVRNLFWSDEPWDARRYVDMGIDVVLTNCAHQLVG